MTLTALIAFAKTGAALVKRNWVPAAVLAGTVLVGGLVIYVKALQHARDQALIAAHDAKAESDTLKVVFASQTSVVVEQLAKYRDSFADVRKQLKDAGTAKTITHVVFQAPPTTAQHHETAPPGPLAGIHTFEDSLHTPLVDVKAAVNVVLGPDSSSADWGWQMRPHPIPVTIDVGCKGRLNPDVLVETPAWIKVDSVRTKVADDVCGAPVSIGSGLSTGAKVGVAGGLILLGWFLHKL